MAVPSFGRLMKNRYREILILLTGASLVCSLASAFAFHLSSERKNRKKELGVPGERRVSLRKQARNVDIPRRGRRASIDASRKEVSFIFHSRRQGGEGRGRGGEVRDARDANAAVI